jgi:hypothetical protein
MPTSRLWVLNCCCAALLLLPPSAAAAASLYLQLQRLYRDQADAEVAAVEAHLGQLLATLGSPGRSIPTSDVKHCCRNARNIRVVRCVYECGCLIRCFTAAGMACQAALLVFVAGIALLF